MHASLWYENRALFGLIAVNDRILRIGCFPHVLQNSLIFGFRYVRNRQAIHLSTRFLAAPASDTPCRIYENAVKFFAEGPSLARVLPGVRRFPVAVPATPEPIIFRKVLLSILAPLYTLTFLHMVVLFI